MQLSVSNTNFQSKYPMSKVKKSVATIAPIAASSIAAIGIAIKTDNNKLTNELNTMAAANTPKVNNDAAKRKLSQVLINAVNRGKIITKRNLASITGLSINQVTSIVKQDKELVKLYKKTIPAKRTNDEWVKELGDLKKTLKEALKNNEKLTLYEISKRSSFTPAEISYIFSGKKNIEDKELIKLYNNVAKAQILKQNSKKSKKILLNFLNQAIKNDEKMSLNQMIEKTGLSMNKIRYALRDPRIMSLYRQVTSLRFLTRSERKDQLNSLIYTLKSAIEKGEKLSKNEIAKRAGLEPWRVSSILERDGFGIINTHDIKKLYKHTIKGHNPELATETKQVKQPKESAEYKIKAESKPEISRRKYTTKNRPQKQYDEQVAVLSSILKEASDKKQRLYTKEIIKIVGLNLKTIKSIIKKYSNSDNRLKDLYAGVVQMGRSITIVHPTADDIKKIIEQAIQNNEKITILDIANRLGVKKTALNYIFKNPELLELYHKVQRKKLTKISPDELPNNFTNSDKIFAEEMVKNASLYGTSEHENLKFPALDDYQNFLEKALCKSQFDDLTKKRISELFEYAPVVVDTILNYKNKYNRLRYLNIDKIEEASKINPILTCELLELKNEDNSFKYNCDEILDIVQSTHNY